MAAWYEVAEFDCEDCVDEPELKKDRGCDGPPIRADGTPTTWGFPPGDPRAEIDCCPTRLLGESPEIWDLFRAGNLAEWRLAVAEQERLPLVYLEAWTMARREQAEAQAARMKAKRDD